MPIPVGTTITPGQFAQLRGAPATSAPPSGPIPVGTTITPDQFAAIRAGKPLKTAAPVPAPTPVAPDMGTLDAQEVIAGRDKAFRGVSEAAKAFDANTAPPNGGVSLDTPQETVKKTGDLLHGAAQAAIGTGRAVFAPFTAAIQKVVQSASDNPAVQAVTTSPAVSAFLDAANKGIGNATDLWAKVENDHPDFARAVSDIAGVAPYVVGGEAAPQTPVGEATAQTFQDASKAAEAIGTQMSGGTGGKISEIINNEFPGLNKDQAQAIKSVAADWQRPADQPVPSFNKARAVLERDPGVPQVLAENGLSPLSYIEQGNYATEDAAAELRTRAGQISRDMLRPSLHFEDYGVPRTPTNEIYQRAVDIVNTDRNLTAANKQTIISHIKDELGALDEGNPNGLTLEQLHDNKITYAQNGGYSPVNEPRVNNLATANRALSTAMGKLVEEKATNVPVEQFNADLQKLYRAADYLDSLNGKKAPVSLTQHVIRGVAKFAGAGIAAHLGGGIFSEFAGYQIGKNVERVLENMTMPMRAQFLQNLQRTNSQAYDAVAQYLQGKMSGFSTSLLPEATTITPPAPSEESQMRGRARTILGPRDASQPVTPTNAPSTIPSSINMPPLNPPPASESSPN